MTRYPLWPLGLLSCCVACAASGPSNAPPQSAAKTESAANAPPAASGASGASTTPSQPEAATTTAQVPKAKAGAESDSDNLTPGTELQVRFLVAEGETEIDVGGVRFVPKATAVKLGKGWGVEVTVAAKVKDGATHHWLVPAQSALAFAGRVTRGGKEERLSDKRVGSDDRLLTPGESVSVTRRFPGETSLALSASDSLELEVGIWGLGTTTENRRPVRRFFRVTFKGAAGQSPRVAIEPPR